MVLQAGSGNGGSGGHWVAQLSRHLVERQEIELGIVTAFPGLRDVHFNEGGVEYFVISQPNRFPAFGLRTIDIERCLAIIEEFRPDIIHIHGSERFYGMIKASGRTSVPTVVSIQGLLGPCSKPRNFFGALTPAEVLKSIRLIEIAAGLGLFWQYFYSKKGAIREAEILSGVDGLLGRTEWDHAHALEYNQKAIYCHVGEILRPAFTGVRWSLNDCDRHTLIYTNAGHPRRGTENLLSAVAFLRKEFPDIRLRLAGIISTRSGYGRFIRRRISELDLDDRVDLLGYLNDTAMVRELLRAHVFAITSYIENSANSLAEAMLVGVPCIASFVGGLPSMVRDNDTGLLYPVEDVPLLADKIRKLFHDDALTVRLGRNAQIVARDRHDPKTVVGQLVSAYDKVRTSCGY
jgi:L-malate glycosyltransferase